MKQPDCSFTRRNQSSWAAAISLVWITIIVCSNQSNRSSRVSSSLLCSSFWGGHYHIVNLDVLSS